MQFPLGQLLGVCLLNGGSGSVSPPASSATPVLQPLGAQQCGPSVTLPVLVTRSLPAVYTLALYSLISHNLSKKV